MRHTRPTWRIRKEEKGKPYYDGRAPRSFTVICRKGMETGKAMYKIPHAPTRATDWY